MQPIKLSWTNPTANDDTSAYAQADNAGYVIAIDAAPQVSIPLVWGTSFDATAMIEAMKLKAGNHTLALAVVSKQGETGKFSPALTFPVFSVPNAPGNFAITRG